MAQTGSEVSGSISIDEPRPEDVDRIGTLFEEDMADLGVETDSDDLRELARSVTEGMAQDPAECLCWVARRPSDDQVVGLVLANFNWSVKFGGRSLWIETLYVTPDARRRGLGRALVEQLLDWAEQHDIRGIDLEAYRGNTPASILYRTLGFHRLGRERFYYRLEGSEYL